MDNISICISYNSSLFSVIVPISPLFLFLVTINKALERPFFCQKNRVSIIPQKLGEFRGVFIQKKEVALSYVIHYGNLDFYYLFFLDKSSLFHRSLSE